MDGRELAILVTQGVLATSACLLFPREIWVHSGHGLGKVGRRALWYSSPAVSGRLEESKPPICSGWPAAIMTGSAPSSPHLQLCCRYASVYLGQEGWCVCTFRCVRESGEASRVGPSGAAVLGGCRGAVVMGAEMECCPQSEGVRGSGQAFGLCRHLGAFPQFQWPVWSLPGVATGEALTCK